MKNTIRIILTVVLLAPLSAYASTTAGTISHTNHYAWSNNSGWVNWDAIGSNVTVTDSAVSGYIWSANHGWINLSPANGGVINDGEGNLSGFAWDSTAGWIDFTGVHINTSGVFSGQTTSNSSFGIMTFDCTHCAVSTDWRPVSVRTPVSTPAPTTSGGGGIPSLLGVPLPQNTPPSVSPASVTEAGPLLGTNVISAVTPRSSSAVAAAAAALPQAQNLFDVQITPAGVPTNQNWLWWAVLGVILVMSGAAAYTLWWFIHDWRRKRVLSEMPEAAIPQESGMEPNPPLKDSMIQAMPPNETNVTPLIP